VNVRTPTIAEIGKNPLTLRCPMRYRRIRGSGAGTASGAGLGGPGSYVPRPGPFRARHCYARNALRGRPDRARRLEDDRPRLTAPDANAPRPCFFGPHRDQAIAPRRRRRVFRCRARACVPGAARRSTRSRFEAEQHPWPGGLWTYETATAQRAKAPDRAQQLVLGEHHLGARRIGPREHRRTPRGTAAAQGSRVAARTRS
jgi:hypothetical protein